jgi:hypothetical protein
MFAEAEFKGVPTPVEPIINTRRSDEAHFLPSFAGVLQMSAQGCVYAQTATRRIDIVWPSGYSVVREPDGTVDVKDVQGRAVATVGSIFSFGEGGSTAEPAELACRAGGPNTTPRDVYPPFDRHGR